MEKEMQVQAYDILYKGGSGEIVVKKSRFIASLSPAKSEGQALSFIEAVKKQFWDARHNCFAYLIGDKNQTVRCSDDGEPSQTAGKPMLDVLLGAGIHDVCLVVTRYFGGTLLGAGGLVRAYSQAAQEGLKNSVAVTRRPGQRLRVITDYNGVGKIQHILGTMGITILDTDYTDQVKISLLVPLEVCEKLCVRITDATNGRAVIETGERLWYGLLEGEVLLL